MVLPEEVQFSIPLCHPKDLRPLCEFLLTRACIFGFLFPRAFERVYTAKLQGNASTAAEIQSAKAGQQKSIIAKQVLKKELSVC